MVKIFNFDGNFSYWIRNFLGKSTKSLMAMRRDLKIYVGISKRNYFPASSNIFMLNLAIIHYGVSDYGYLL